MPFSKEELDHIWNETLNQIKKKISDPSFNTWFANTEPFQLKGNNFILKTPNDFIKEWIIKRYQKLISSIIKDLTENNYNIEVLTTEELGDLKNINNKIKTKNKKKKIINKKNNNNNNKNKNFELKNGLNPKYTFDSFVVGNSNRFAHAASLAVAEAPAKAYNPLFIYGDVGLGKTHVMQAIAHFILSHNPDYKVVYASSETFTNELINAIKDDKTISFRNKYRNIDILLIDDIQFLADKERTQEEFFHTFNSLHETNRQLIISSDRPPKEIPTLEERLRSRFEWGLITDIQKPDLETRIAILRKKADIENLEIPNEVIIYIANKIQSNIRELEGALTKVIAYSSLVNRDIDSELTQEALKDLVNKNNDKNIIINIESIKNKVSDYYKLNDGDMESKKRTHNIVFPRHIAMYLSRELTNSSLPQIGKEFGGRDHTTVIHAHNKIANRIENETDFKQTMDRIINLIKN